MLKLGERTFESRLLLGTARYPSPRALRDAIARSGCGVVTVALRRHGDRENGGAFRELVASTGAAVLPNTAGCRSVREAITTAHMARELFGTHWIKLEITGDEDSLAPDPFALVAAAEALVKDGFEVFPYMTEDIVVAERLVALGCRILMPWGAPIGTGRGLQNPPALRALRARFPDVTLVVDAGIGRPSHAAQAMELGMDAVLLNTAVALAADPPAMAQAFAEALRAGRRAYAAGPMEERDMAVPSTPLLGRPFAEEA